MGKYRARFCATMLVAGLTIPFNASADNYPERTVEIVIPFAPGGVTDVLGRALADGLTQQLKRPFVIVNKPGATGALGSKYVANTKPDGYVLLFTAAAMLTVTPIMQTNAGYDRNSFESICQTFRNEMAIIVKPDSAIKSVSDLIRIAKERPGALSYGHLGVGGIPHLAMTELGKVAGVTFNPIPMKGDGEVLPAVIGGHVDFGAVTLSSAAQAGVHVLGIFGNSRNATLPAAPTVKEQGFDVAPASFGGLYAPAGLSRSVKQTLAEACRTVAKSSGYVAVAKRLNQPEDYYADSGAFARSMAKDADEKTRLLREVLRN